MHTRTMKRAAARTVPLLAGLLIAGMGACRDAATAPLAPTCYYWKVDTVLAAHIEGAPPNTITEIRTCVVHGR